MFKVGDKISLTVTVTDDMVRKFAELSGDFNPIHLDEEYAKTTVFKRRIAHGMLTGAFISRLLATLVRGGVYLSQTMKFVNPVYLDDVITVEATVTGVREEKGIGTLETIARNQKGENVVKGEAIVLGDPTPAKK